MVDVEIAAEAVVLLMHSQSITVGAGTSLHCQLEYHHIQLNTMAAWT